MPIRKATSRECCTSIERGSAPAKTKTFDYAQQAWDLISVLYAPVPITDPSYVARMTSTLVSGGVVVVESFASDRDARRRKPVDIDPAELRDAFVALGFRLDRLQDVVERPDWAVAPERMVRMVAVKA